MTDFIERIRDLEHDNNVLRSEYARLSTEILTLRHEFDEVGEKVKKLIAKVNEFVGRFQVIQ